MSDTGRKYRTETTGPAQRTVLEHASESDAIPAFFGACFCPFVQRAWLALELLGEPYRYYEVDPYAKPAALLEVSPKGLVPALKFSNATNSSPRSLHESTVILEYLEDVARQQEKHLLLPPDPYERARARLIGDHINRAVVPSFYRYLQAQDTESQIQGGKEFNESLASLVEKLETTPPAAAGLWVAEATNLGWADVMAGPWLYRAKVVLTHYRGWTPPVEGTKTRQWIERIISHPVFVKTTSTEDLYLDSYERYAFNRPNTSQVANAINSGRGLP